MTTYSLDNIVPTFGSKKKKAKSGTGALSVDSSSGGLADTGYSTGYGALGMSSQSSQTIPQSGMNNGESIGVENESMGFPTKRRGKTKTVLSVNEILNISRKTMGV